MAKKAAGKVTKADAVRAALADGVQMPEDGVGYVKEKFGLDVTKGQFSTYKSLAKKSGGKRSGKKSGGRPKKAMVSTVAGNTVRNGMVALDDLEAAKALVAKVGAEQAKRLVGLFE